MNSKEKDFISVVVYVHNDGSQAGNFLKNINCYFARKFEHYEIICVDDDCSDSSVEHLRKAAEEIDNCSVTILHMSAFHGIELAMSAGVDLAIGDFVFEFDHVYQDYPLELLDELYKHMMEGNDIVSVVPERPSGRGRLFYWLLEKHTKGKCQFQEETFRILSRRAINRVMGMNVVVYFSRTAYARCGLNIYRKTYIPFEDQKRKEDKDLVRYKRRRNIDSLMLFTDIGYRFSLLMAFLMMGVTVFTALYAIVVYLLGTPIAGWTTTISFLSLAFFGLFSILTIMLKYLTIIVDLLYRKQRYNYREIEKITK